MKPNTQSSMTNKVGVSESQSSNIDKENALRRAQILQQAAAIKMKASKTFKQEDSDKKELTKSLTEINNIEDAKEIIKNLRSENENLSKKLTDTKKIYIDLVRRKDEQISQLSKNIEENIQKAKQKDEDVKKITGIDKEGQGQLIEITNLKKELEYAQNQIKELSKNLNLNLNLNLNGKGQNDKFSQDETMNSKFVLSEKESLKYKELQEEYKNIKIQLDEANKELNVQKNEALNFDSKFKDQDKIIKYLKSEIDEETKKYDAILQKYNTLKVEHNNLNLNNLNLNKQKRSEDDEKLINKYTKDIEIMQEKLKNKESEIDKNGKEIEMLKSLINEKDDTIKLYSEKNNKIEGNLKKIDLSYEDLLANYQELSNKNKEYKELLKSIQSSDNDGNNSSPKIEITNKICKLENELKRANEEICRLEYEKTDLYQKIESQEVDLHFKNSEIEDLNEKLNNEIENLNQVIQEKIQEINSLKDSNKNDNNKSNNSKKESNEKDYNIIQMELNTKIKNLEKELLEKDKEIQSFHNTLNSNKGSNVINEISKNEIKSKDEKIKELNEQIKKHTSLLEHIEVDYEAKLKSSEVQTNFYKKSYEELLINSNNSKIGITNPNNDEYIKEIENLRAEIEELRKNENYDIDQILLDLTNLKEENEKLKSDQQINEQRLFDSKILLAEENNNYRNEIETLEKQVVKTKLMYAQIATERDLLITKNEELNSEISKIKKK